MDLVRDDVRPSPDHHARRARERDRVDRRRRAARRTACCTCSPSRASSASLSSSTTSTGSRRGRRSSPSLKPGGRFVATDMHEAGGVGLVARELLKRDLVHAGAPNVDGRSLGEMATAVAEQPGPGGRRPDRDADQAHRRARDPAREPRAGGVRRQARRARAPAPPRAGARVRLRGGLLRGRQGREHRAGRRRRDPLRGPGRRAGHARDAPRHGRDRRRGARRLGRARHRRALLGRDARAHGRPRRARRRRAAARSRPSTTGDTVVVDVEARELRVELSDDEIAARLAGWKPPPPRYPRPASSRSTRRWSRRPPRARSRARRAHRLALLASGGVGWSSSCSGASPP